MFVSCKIDIFLLPKLLDITFLVGLVIISSVGRCVDDRWVGGSVSKWSVVGWSVDRQSVDLIKPELHRPTLDLKLPSKIINPNCSHYINPYCIHLSTMPILLAL